MQSFLTSTIGSVSIAVFGVLVFFGVVGALNKGRVAVKAVTFSALMLAIATTLSLVSVSFAFGGSITLCSMLFVILIGYRFGAGSGFSAAIAYGLLQFAIRPEFYHPIQFFLDYLLGFGMLGASGFFRSQKLKSKSISLHGYKIISMALLLAICVPMLLRLTFSVISGVVFFAEYAPEGMSPAIYSLVYNAGYIIPEMILTLALVSIPKFKSIIELSEK